MDELWKSIHLAQIDAAMSSLDHAAAASDRWLFLAVLVILLGAFTWAVRYFAWVNEKKHDETREAIHGMEVALNKSTELGCLQLLANPNFPDAVRPRVEQLLKEVKP